MIKAIETNYKGYRFRSRLEARWAVFFDSLGVKWQFEPEGYELGELGRYLPDFFLPEVSDGTWIEVKPESCTSEEDLVANKKMQLLVEYTKFKGMVVAGEPFVSVELAQNANKWKHGWWMWENYEDMNGAKQVGGDGPYLFCKCPWCGKIGIEFDGRGARVCGYKAHYPDEASALNAIKKFGHWRADDKCYTGDDIAIINAANAARSARFEFGQSGASR